MARSPRGLREGYDFSITNAMDQFGRYIMAAGAGLFVLGVAVWLMGRLGFRGLPGDIVYRSDRVTFYFPIVTCLVISALLTGLVWLWAWLSRR